MSFSHIGLLLILVGAGWWLGTRLIGLVPSFFHTDQRTELFKAYLLLSDHVSACGNETQKQAMETVLPCIATKQDTPS